MSKLGHTRYLFLLALLELTGCGGGSGSSNAEAGVTPPPPSSPQVNIVVPTNNPTSSTPVTVTVTANVSESAAIQEVSLLRDNVLVSTANTMPYEWTLSGLPSGRYMLTARVTDSNGTVGQSSIFLDVADPQTVVWAVNAGGPAVTALDGTQYAADEGYTGGAAAPFTTTVRGTHNPVLYQSERWGQFSYAHGLPNGRYHVTLRFAENYWALPNNRKFAVDIEGVTRVNDLDLVTLIGAQTAYDITIPNIDVTDGQLNLDFRGSIDSATVNAIVVTAPYPNNGNHKTLVWSDEFNATCAASPCAPDATKWSYEVQAPFWVNQELQRYTSRLENARVENGVLVIEARHDNYLGAAYSSGRIHSRGKGNWLYGRIEVRAKLPGAGRGTWPAIWMLPTNERGYGNGWPDSGELDIMEHVGFDHGRVHATTHNRNNHANPPQHQAAVLEPSVADQFHVYAMDWNDNIIHFYIDDALYFSYINDHQGWQSWPYDKPFYLVLNLAVGGAWGGVMGVDPTIWPQRMEVDYVRVYQ